VTNSQAHIKYSLIVFVNYKKLSFEPLRWFTGRLKSLQENEDIQCHAKKILFHHFSSNKYQNQHSDIIRGYHFNITIKKRVRTLDRIIKNHYLSVGEITQQLTEWQYQLWNILILLLFKWLITI